MHVAEGVLSPAVLGTGAVLTALGTTLGLRNLDYEKLLTTGILAAVFFVASLIHIPIGVSSAHLLGVGLLGVFLGWAAFPAILIALFLQAFFFQYGGLIVLGVNTLNMALAAVLASYLYHAQRAILAKVISQRLSLSIAAFLAGSCGVIFAALFTAAALAFSHEGFQAAALALLLAHLPIMVAEGLLTMLTINFMAKVRPEFLPKSPKFWGKI
ncbi:MAG: cobalt transporter CbiM [Desulfovibrio sp.]|nr:cobalt transporter CbiM [Desulfovibrio sp.]